MLREEYDTKRDGDNESRDSRHATDCRVSLHNAYQLHLRGLVFFDRQAHSAMKDGATILLDPSSTKEEFSSYQMANLRR